MRAVCAITFAPASLSRPDSNIESIKQGLFCPSALAQTFARFTGSICRLRDGCSGQRDYLRGGSLCCLSFSGGPLGPQ
jgi:hypothetical protein